MVWGQNTEEKASLLTGHEIRFPPRFAKHETRRKFAKLRKIDSDKFHKIFSRIAPQNFETLHKKNKFFKTLFLDNLIPFMITTSC